MMQTGKYLRKLLILAASAGLLGIAGCGGSDDEEESASAGGSSLGLFLLCVTEVLTTGNDACAEAAASSGGSTGGGSTGSGSGGGSAGGGSGSGGSTTNSHIYLMPNDEMEPNDDLINANIPRFATRADPNDQTGWIVDGAANDLDDMRDAFAVTPRRAFRYRISLCPPEGVSCQDSVGLDPLTLFWRVLDQDRNEIASSQAAISNKSFVNLEAGLIYYVVVDAGDTMGATVGYRLFVYELR